MGQAAAHHADVGGDRDRLEPEPLEDPDVRAVVGPVACVEAIVVSIAAIGVLHHELADPDEAAPRAWLVAELGLEVVEPDWQLPVGPDDVPEEVGHDLLVGHRDHHVPVAAVLEPGHLRADLVVAAGFAPQVGRDGSPASPAPGSRSRSSPRGSPARPAWSPGIQAATGNTGRTPAGGRSPLGAGVDGTASRHRPGRPAGSRRKAGSGACRQGYRRPAQAGRRNT